MSSAGRASAPLRHRPAPEEVRDRELAEVGELAGVEERAEAGTSFLVPDVGLARIHHPDHAPSATRTAVSVHRVLRPAHGRVADINRGRGALLPHYPLRFPRIEPQPAATKAAVDLRAV